MKGLLFLISIILLTSCGPGGIIQKRKHRKGFHVDLKKDNTAPISPDSTLLIKTDTISYIPPIDTLTPDTSCSQLILRSGIIMEVEIVSIDDDDIHFYICEDSLKDNYKISTYLVNRIEGSDHDNYLPPQEITNPDTNIIKESQQIIDEQEDIDFEINHRRLTVALVLTLIALVIGFFVIPIPASFILLAIASNLIRKVRRSNYPLHQRLFIINLLNKVVLVAAILFTAFIGLLIAIWGW